MLELVVRSCTRRPSSGVEAQRLHDKYWVSASHVGRHTERSHSLENTRAGVGSHGPSKTSRRAARRTYSVSPRGNSGTSPASAHASRPRSITSHLSDASPRCRMSAHADASARRRASNRTKVIEDREWRRRETRRTGMSPKLLEPRWPVLRPMGQNSFGPRLAIKASQRAEIGHEGGHPASGGEAALRLRGPMASIVAQADLPPEDETWKAEVKKPPRDNAYQTEEDATKGRPRHSRRARPRPL